MNGPIWDSAVATSQKYITIHRKARNNTQRDIQLIAVRVLLQNTDKNDTIEVNATSGNLRIFSNDINLNPVRTQIQNGDYFFFELSYIPEQLRRSVDPKASFKISTANHYSTTIDIERTPFNEDLKEWGTVVLKSIPEYEKGNVSVVVQDEDEGNYVNNLSVYLGQRYNSVKFPLNYQGNNEYRVDSVPQGKYTLYAKGRGYADYFQTYEVKTVSTLPVMIKMSKKRYAEAILRFSSIENPKIWITTSVILHENCDGQFNSLFDQKYEQVLIDTTGITSEKQRQCTAKKV